MYIRLLLQVFENSGFFRDIERNGANHIFRDHNRYHLIADSAFGLKTWLMTPYRNLNNLTQRQRYHNYCLSSDRIVIEQAFGILKGRWRKLQYINTYNICKSIEIAAAACILHNFCILQEDLWTDDLHMEERMLFGDGRVDYRGQIKRNNIADEIFNQH